MDDVDIRPLAAADIPAAHEISYAALLEAGRRYGWEMPEPDDAGRERGHRRLAHALKHDADGSFVAERDGEVVGVAVATRRGPLWFLSLLTVATSAQSRGIGRRLLDAAMTTLDESGAICASSDPKALRRYRRAGFDLLPSYEAKGDVDRSVLPAVGGVRAGSYDDDRELIERVATLRRGAPHGPDLEYFDGPGAQLFVIDQARDQGYVVCAEPGPAVLGATSVEAATALLWTCLAEATQPARVPWISHDQQWAIDVALDARLELRSVGARCVKSPRGVMSPYLPNGGLG